MTSPAADENDHDVFVSYSHLDEEWVVNTLLPRLEAAGLKVCIDYRDFMPGRPAMHNMRDAVQRSKRTLLVMTPNWVASQWSNYEAIAVRNSDPIGIRQRTIPILCKQCSIPEDVGFLTYVDFTHPDRLDLAWRQLVTALGGTSELPKVEQPIRDQWFLAHPYAMPPSFTGRLAERRMLTGWLAKDAAHPLLVLCALGGFGKSALVWHWLLHDVDPERWPRVLWWSFYEPDARFDRFILDTLRYLSGDNDDPAMASRLHVDALLRQLRSCEALLVLDGFERELRGFGGPDAAYQGEGRATQKNDRDTISPLAEAFLRGLATLPRVQGRVLLTTRLRPSTVETRGGSLLQGAREEALKQLAPADAVAFFRAQGIRGGRAEIEAACEPYGYHPLSLRLLSGLIVNDLQQPGDVAAAHRLDVNGDLVQRQHHVLEQAYDSLSPTRQNMLSHIACLRAPVTFDALRAMAPTPSEMDGRIASGTDGHEPPPTQRSWDADLRDLIGRGLLQRDLTTNRFDLHPIVRRYSYDRLTVEERVRAHARLRDYFATVPVREGDAGLHLPNGRVVDLRVTRPRPNPRDSGCPAPMAHTCSQLAASE